MQTNKLTEKIELLEVKYSGGTMGISVPYYRTVNILFASITNQRGQNGFDQGNIYTDSISFYLRYTSLMKAKKHVVKCNGELYELNNVTHIRRNVATIIDCKRVD